MTDSAALVMSVAPVEAIVRLAVRYPVFPCRARAEEVTTTGRTRVLKAKSPLTIRGFLDASQDADRIRTWWRRWPDALVGVPTGAATDLVVLDYDSHKADDDARDWIGAHTNWLLQTRAHTTLNGGRHYLFRRPPDQQHRGGVNLILGGGARVGIDLRAEGGYIIWWPLHGGQATGEIAPLPAGMIDERRIEKRELPPLPAATPIKWQRDRARLIDALAWLDPANYETWARYGMAIHLASGGSDDGFQLWHAWSAGEIAGEVPPSYAGIDDCRYHWASYTHEQPRENLVTLGSLFRAAREAGWPRMPAHLEPPPDIEQPPAPDQAPGWIDGDPIDVPAPEKPAPPDTRLIRHRLDWPALAPQTPPERLWIIDHWVGAGHITLLAGPPGSGKTALAQVMGSAVALGNDLIDAIPQPRTVLAWLGEDDADELWRRQNAIAKLHGVGLSAYAERFHVLPLASEDLTLWAQGRDGGGPTARLVELREQIGDLKAEFVILDSIARTFGGNENDRHQVTSFIAALNWACEPTRAGLLAIGHPAKSIGSEFSGSTAWEASVRARLFFGFQMPDVPVDAEAAIDPTSPIRYLAKRKTNYSVRDWREVRYTEGVMVPTTPEPGAVPAGRSPGWLADEAIRCLRQLTRLGIEVSHAPNSSAYLPRAAKAAGLTSGQLTEGDLKRGLAECLRTNRVKVGTVGQYANRASKKGLVEC